MPVGTTYCWDLGAEGGGHFDFERKMVMKTF